MTNEWPGYPPVILQARGVHKSYHRGSEVPVLRGVDLDIRRGELVSIVGSSGSGKTTLLHVLGTLDAPSEGEVYCDGQRIDDRPDVERDRFRNEVVGFVFQFYHLLPELSLLENVLLGPLIRLSGWRFLFERRRLIKEAKDLIDRVGLSHRIKHRPSELSGGEMQRAAIARALLPRPRVLLADEPTGNLDAETGDSIARLLFEIRRETELAIVLVTHNQALANQADRQYRLLNGRLEDGRRSGRIA